MADNSRFRCLGNWTGPIPEYKAVHELFPDGFYPHGVVTSYKEDSKEEDTEAWEKRLVDLRQAAEAHRMTRRHIQSFIQPDVPILDIVKELEAHSSLFVGASGLTRGRGFPTGMSLNHVAAHDTPNPVESKPKILEQGDILKIDFGTHVNGNIIDCAWTVAFDESFDPLIKATQEATNLGLKMAAPDMAFSEIASAMGEVITSYEMEKDGKTYEIKPIRNLNGHTMEPYRIHAGKSLPFCKVPINERMRAHEVYAIETFATANGFGQVHEDGDCSHYMLEAGNLRGKVQSLKPKAKNLYNTIQSKFGTLAFSQRWLKEAMQDAPYAMDLSILVRTGIVQKYPPLVDKKGSWTSQMEHTIALGEFKREVLSRGDDF